MDDIGFTHDAFDRLDAGPAAHPPSARFPGDDFQAGERAQHDRAFATAQDILLSHGITTVADMGTSGDDWTVIRRAGDSGRLRLRILSYAFGIEPLLAVAGTQPTPWLYDSKLRMVGVKLYSDGALGSRGAWLKQPYADAAGERGLAFLSDAEIRNLMSRAAMDGFQVAVHAIGDRATTQVVDAFEGEGGTYRFHRDAAGRVVGGGGPPGGWVALPAAVVHAAARSHPCASERCSPSALGRPWAPA